MNPASIAAGPGRRNGALTRAALLRAPVLMPSGGSLAGQAEPGDAETYDYLGFRDVFG